VFSDLIVLHLHASSRDNLAKHDVNCNFNAGDTLSYAFVLILCSKCHIGLQVSGLQSDRLMSCLADIRSWMSANFLKLNADKTELLLVGYSKRIAKLQNFFKLR